MGRDMYTVIKNESGRIIWSSAELFDIDCEHEDTAFCGRNEETGAIANRVDNEGFFDITDPAVFKETVEMLRELQMKADRMRKRAQTLIANANMASIHVGTLNEFLNFVDYIDSLHDDYDDIYWNRAEDMIGLMDHTREKFEAMNKPNYRMCWVNDE